MGYRLPFPLQDPASVIRTAFFSGLIPLVTVTFEEPVHSVKQKPEELQIRMEAAPYRISGGDLDLYCGLRDVYEG